MSRTLLSPNFAIEEFMCNHCAECPDSKQPPQELLDLLEAIREEFDSPVVINSGYRCPVHNHNVGGAKHSQHLQGTAADIVVKGVDPVTVYAAVDKLVGDKGGVGRYNGFTHLDVRGHKSRW